MRNLAAAIALLLIGLLGPGAASAVVKCQCNNGMISHAMDADYGDEDADEDCNDACSELGGGRVWSIDRDGEGNGDDDVTIRRERPTEQPAARR